MLEFRHHLALLLSVLVTVSISPATLPAQSHHAGRRLNEHIQAKDKRETGRSNLPARPESGNLSRRVN